MKFLCTLIALFSIANLSIAQQQPLYELQKLVASDGNSSDKFGAAVDITANVAVVGAPQHFGFGGFSAGAAYVFEKMGGQWQQVAKLRAADGAPYDYFGSAVAIYKNTIVVGAPKDNYLSFSDRGSAYVFEKKENTWQQTVKLEPFKVDRRSTGVSNDDYETEAIPYNESQLNFGRSVDISGNYIAVASSGVLSMNVFEKDASGWKMKAVYRTSSSDCNYLKRAQSVSIGKNYFQIGNPNYHHTTDCKGQIPTNTGGLLERVYADIGNSQAYKFKNVTTTAGFEDHIGLSVAAYGEYAAYGTSENKGILKGPNPYFYYLIQADDSSPGDKFSWSISITSGGTILAGAPGDDDQGTDSGSAYILAGDTIQKWHQTHKLLASDGSAFDNFGHSVSIHNQSVIVGAPLDDDRGYSSGSVYFYEIENQTPVEVTSISLIDRLSKEEIRKLRGENIINTNELPSTYFDIIAQSNSENISSVQFSLNGPSSYEVEDYKVPFTLFGAESETFSQELKPGEYVLSIRPVSVNSENKKVLGELASVQFTLVNEPAILVFPNPFKEEAFIQTEVENKIIAIQLYSARNEETFTIPQEWIQIEEEGIRVNMREIPAGPYILQVTIGKEQHALHVSKY